MHYCVEDRSDSKNNVSKDALRKRIGLIWNKSDGQQVVAQSCGLDMVGSFCVLSSYPSGDFSGIFFCINVS